MVNPAASHDHLLVAGAGDGPNHKNQNAPEHAMAPTSECLSVTRMACAVLGQAEGDRPYGPGRQGCPNSSTREMRRIRAPLMSTRSRCSSRVARLAPNPWRNATAKEAVDATDMHSAWDRRGSVDMVPRPPGGLGPHPRRDRPADVRIGLPAPLDSHGPRLENSGSALYTR